MGDENNDSGNNAPPASSTPPAAAPPSAPPAPPQDNNETPPPQDGKGYWPEDWRTRMAGEDEKVLKQLGRYANPEEVWKKARSLEQRLSSGELRSILPKDAKPEEVKRWREENGIPEAPEKYDTDIGKELVKDSPYVNEFLKAAHASNQTPEQVKATLKSFYAVKDEMDAQRVEEDKTLATKAEDALRGDWGAEYRRNINLIHGLLDGSGSQDLKDSFLHGRLADGTPIGSSPEALKLLLNLALVNNPAGTVVSSSSGNVMGTLEDEISKIEKTMASDRRAYNKDEKMQTRYRELLVAREQLKKRAA